MKFKNAIQNFPDTALITILRFPIPTLFSLIFCILSVNRSYDSIILWKYLSILFCGFFWFIALKLFIESHKLGNKAYYAIGIPIFLVLAWYLYIQPDISVVYGFLASGLFLSVFLAPFLNKHYSSQQMWEFNYHMFTHICLTILAAFILWIGVISIISSLSFLFVLTFYDSIYLDAWLVAATIFAPIIAMAGIPKLFDTDQESHPKAICIILSYILIPLLLIYGLILYAYLAKILVTWSLPTGGVAYLVSAFGSIGTGVYLACYSMCYDTGIIGFFSRNFFKILLAPLSLYAIAIGMRIYEYGITENRYAIALCFTWLASSTFFVLLKGNYNAPKFILASIVFLLIAASFGPLSAVNISGRSQLNRLVSLLEKNEILVGDKIHKSNHELSISDASNIKSIVQYLVETKKVTLIKPWFNQLPEGTDAILQEMGVDWKMLKKDRYITFSNSDARYTDIAGYDYYIEEIGNKTIVLGNSGISLSAKLDKSANYIITINNTEHIAFGLNGLIEQLTLGTQINPVLERKGGNITVRVIVNNLDGEFKKDSNRPVILYFNAVILVKKS